MGVHGLWHVFIPTHVRVSEYVVVLGDIEILYIDYCVLNLADISIYWVMVSSSIRLIQLYIFTHTDEKFTFCFRCTVVAWCEHL